MKKLKVGVAGFRGYAGEELVNLLSRHPFVEVQSLFTTGPASRGSLPKKFPRALNSKVRTLPKKNAARGLDLLFTATPQGVAGNIFRNSPGPCRGIDLSADYRLSSGLYQKTYGQKVPDVRGLTKEGRLFDVVECRINFGELAGVTFSPDGNTMFCNTLGDPVRSPPPAMTFAIWGPWGDGRPPVALSVSNTRSPATGYA